jgi:hypothetical protein
MLASSLRLWAHHLVLPVQPAAPPAGPPDLVLAPPALATAPDGH